MADAGRLSGLAIGPPRSAAQERWARLRRLGWTGFVLLALYAVIVGGSWAGIYWVELRVTSLALAAAGLIAWLLVALWRPRWRPATAIWPAIVLPLLALGVSALASPFPRLGLEYVAWATLLVGLYLLLVRFLAWPDVRLRLGALAAILGLSLCAIYLGWSVALWVEWWALAGPFTPPPMRPLFGGLTWGNPSAVLTVSVLLLLIAAAGLGTATRRARVVLAVLAAMTAMVVIISGSRAGWIALGGALVVVGLLRILPSLWHRSASLRDWSMPHVDPRTRAVVAIGAILGGSLVLLSLPGILARLETGGDGGRPIYFAVALRMFIEHPVLGLGPGTWAARRPAYTETGELDFIVSHAHDIYLQAAAELGLVGLVAGAVAAGCVAWLVISALRGDRPWRRRWAWAAVFGLVYLALHDLLDSYANLPAVLVLAAIPMALLDATSERRLGLPSGLRRLAIPLRSVALGALIAGSAMAMVALGRAESTALTHQQAVLAIDQADHRAALRPAIRAVRDDPLVAPYQQTLALAAAGSGAWHAAADAFRAAAQIDDLPASWLGLAVAQQRIGEPAHVVDASLREALRLGRQQAAIAFAAAQVYDSLGMTTASDEAFVEAILRLPQLAAAASWDRAGVDDTRFRRLLDMAIGRSPGEGWRLALMAGDHERARALAPSPGGFARLVIDGWGGDAAALRAVRSIADARPFDPWTLSWAGLVSSHAGDDESARRYRRLLELASQDPASTSTIGIGRRIAWRDADVGTNSGNYGDYMHRRSSPQDLIVPGLAGLTLLDPVPSRSWLERAVPWTVLTARR